MSNRSLKVRKIFALLRGAMGAEVPAQDLLALAALLVDSPHVERQQGASSRGYDSDPYVMPLDAAFADGGWRLMANDEMYIDHCHQEDFLDYGLHNRRHISKLALEAQ